MELSFTIYGDANDLSPNQRFGHWASRNSRVRAWHQKALWCAKASGIQPGRIATPATISFHIRRGDRMDDDNLKGSGALKAIRDTLFPQDREVFTGVVTLEVNRKYRRCEEVVVTVVTPE